MKSAVLKHPATVLAGVAAGVVLGLLNGRISRAVGITNFAALIAIPGQLYLFYLQMTVIPIVITAIASSLGKLMRNKSSAGLIRRIVAVFVLCMMAVALVGMGLGIIGRPGSGLDEETQSLLAKLISQGGGDTINGVLEINLSSGLESVPAGGRPGLASFFSSLIPSNIFHALTMGSTMAIVFFSIIFGVAIGFLKEESASLLIGILSAIFEAFQKLINWSLYLLPFGLVCLMAGQVAALGPQIFIAMSKFIILYSIGTAVIFILASVIIWIRSGIASPGRVFLILFEPLLLAFVTRNSMATLPSAITSLDKKLKFNGTAVNLTMPLGMTLGRFGNIFYFALAVFFVVQIYGAGLGAVQYAVIFLGVILSGTATAGASGIVTLSMLSIVLNPLNLPVEAVLVVFMAIDPIIDPFRTLLIVHVNMAAAALIARREDGGNGPDMTETIAGESPDDEETAGPAQRPFTAYIQNDGELPPLLFRRGNELRGMEIELLKEIGRRLGRPVLIRDALTMGYDEGIKARREADIIGGLVKKCSQADGGEEQETEPPLGFFFSRPWATVTRHKVKTPVCFLLPDGSSDVIAIDGIIKELNAKNFLALLGGGEK